MLSEAERPWRCWSDVEGAPPPRPPMDASEDDEAAEGGEEPF